MPTGRKCADGLPLHEVYNPHQAQPCEQEAIVLTPLWCMRSTRRPTMPTGSNRADGCPLHEVYKNNHHANRYQSCGRLSVTWGSTVPTVSDHAADDFQLHMSRHSPVLDTSTRASRRAFRSVSGLILSPFGLVKSSLPCRMCLLSVFNVGIRHRNSKEKGKKKGGGKMSRLCSVRVCLLAALNVGKRHTSKLEKGTKKKGGGAER